MLLFVVLSDIFADQWLEDKLSNDFFFFSSSDSVLPKLLIIFEDGMSYHQGNLRKRRL